MNEELKEKKKFNKKYLAFGILGLFALALVTAGLLTYYGQIQQNVNVEQAVVLSGVGCNNNVCIDDIGTVYSPNTRISGLYVLTNHDPVNSRDVELVTRYNPGIVDGEIVTSYEYLLENLGEISGATCGGYDTPGWRERCEKRIVLNVPMALDNLDTISWSANVMAGYAPHVDVILDNGKSLTFEYATIDADCNVPSMYPEGEINTFDDMGIVNDNAYAWESLPGPCTGDDSVAFFEQHNTLAEWKTEYSGANIVRIELEIDNWISASNSDVSGILINGNSVEVSGLNANSELDFQIVNEFMTNGYNGTITTEVQPVAE